LSEHFDSGPYDLVFSSDLSRALDTCKLIVDNRKQIITDLNLRERSFGPFEGKTLDQLKQFAAKEGFPSSKLSEFTPIGGESLPQVNQRVKNFLNDRLLKSVSIGSHVLVVSHGGVIREMMRYFRDELKCDFKDKSPLTITPNTSVNQFKLFHNNIKLISVECLKLHDISHLSGQNKASALNEEQINDKPNDGNQEAL
jgi:broad specificity phosphatase PhoE